MAKKPKTKSAPVAEPIETKERLSDLDHIDALNFMKFRLYGLRSAVTGINFASPDVKGTLQLCEDACDQLEACAYAFEAERKRRRAETQ